MSDSEFEEQFQNRLGGMASPSTASNFPSPASASQFPVPHLGCTDVEDVLSLPINGNPGV